MCWRSSSLKTEPTGSLRGKGFLVFCIKTNGLNLCMFGLVLSFLQSWDSKFYDSEVIKWQVKVHQRCCFCCLHFLNPCRFALVCVGSEASSRKLMELLSKRELHGQNPIVTPCNKQSLSQFEMQSRKSKWEECKRCNIVGSWLEKHMLHGKIDRSRH